LDKNPFLEENHEEEKEEPYVIQKPFKKEELTEAQKKRNFKGLELIKEALKKVVPHRVL